MPKINKEGKQEIKVGKFVKDAVVVQMVWKTKNAAVNVGYVDPDFPKKGLYVPICVTIVAKVTPSGVVSVVDNTDFWRVSSNSDDIAEYIGSSYTKKNGNPSNILRVIEPDQIFYFEKEISRWNKLNDEYSIKATNEHNEKTLEDYYTAINAYDAAVKAGVINDHCVIKNSKMMDVVVRVFTFPSAVFLVTTKYSPTKYYNKKEVVHDIIENKVVTGRVSVTGHINLDSNYINNYNFDVSIDIVQWSAWEEAGIIDKVEIENYLLGKAYMEILKRINS